MMNEYSAISPSRNVQWSGKTFRSSVRRPLAAWNRSSSSAPCFPSGFGMVSRPSLVTHPRSQKLGPTGSWKSLWATR